MALRIEELAKTIDCTLLDPRAGMQEIEAVSQTARELHLASLCVLPKHTAAAAEHLRGSDVKVCAVIGYLEGGPAAKAKIAEAERCLDEGAKELEFALNVRAMLAGDLPLSAVSSAAVVEADLAGAQIDIIAGVVNRANNMVMATPDVATMADFRGRRVGVPRLGDSNDFLVRYALRQAGLEPDRDVSILQIGLNSEMLTAMQNGAIEGGAMSSPTTIRARRLSGSGTTTSKCTGRGRSGGNCVATASAPRAAPLSG